MIEDWYCDIELYTPGGLFSKRFENVRFGTVIYTDRRQLTFQSADNKIISTTLPYYMEKEWKLPPVKT